MIKKIKINGFKDQFRIIELSGLDLITSDDVNGVGKSSVLEAFKLALLGEIPGRAKQLEDILHFTSVSEMTVGVLALKNQESTWVERAFHKNSENGEKRPMRINRTPRKYEEGSRWIRDFLGPVSVSFDPGEFIHLNPQKKREWIFSHSPESLRLNREILETILTARVFERRFGSGLLQSIASVHGLDAVDRLHDSDYGYSTKNFLSSLRETFIRQDRDYWNVYQRAFRKCFFLWRADDPLEKNITSMLTYIKSEIKRLKTNFRERSAALACLGETVAGESKFPLSMEVCREEINSLNRRWEGLNQRIIKLESVRQERKKTQSKILFFKENVARITVRLNEENPQQTRGVIEDLKEKRVDLTPLQEELFRRNEELGALAKKCGRQETLLLFLSNDLKLKNTKLEALGEKKCHCPIADEIRCDTDFQPFAEQLRKDIESLAAVHAKESRAFHSSKHRMDGLKERIDALQNDISEAARKKEEIHQQIKKFSESLAEKENEAAKIEGMRKAYEAELALLENDGGQSSAENISEENLAVLEAEKFNLEKMKRDREADLSKLLRDQGKAEAVSLLRNKKERAQKEWEAFKCIYELLGPRGIQWEIAGRIGAGLEMEVNEMLRWIDPTCRFVLNLRPGHFEMGWNRDGKIIPFNTINSAHFILFAVPLLTALVRRMAAVREKSGLPTLKALCIEAESLTPRNLTRLLQGISVMKARGYLENVLVAHYHSIRDPAKLGGFKEHILRGPETSAARMGSNEIKSEEAVVTAVA